MFYVVSSVDGVFIHEAEAENVDERKIESFGMTIHGKSKSKDEAEALKKEVEDSFAEWDRLHKRVVDRCQKVKVKHNRGVIDTVSQCVDDTLDLLGWHSY